MTKPSTLISKENMSTLAATEQEKNPSQLYQQARMRKNQVKRHSILLHSSKSLLILPQSISILIPPRVIYTQAQYWYLIAPSSMLPAFLVFSPPRSPSLEKNGFARRRRLQLPRLGLGIGSELKGEWGWGTRWQVGIG